jgi:hypothetical protein
MSLGLLPDSSDTGGVTAHRTLLLVNRSDSAEPVAPLLRMGWRELTTTAIESPFAVRIGSLVIADTYAEWVPASLVHFVGPAINRVRTTFHHYAALRTEKMGHASSLAALIFNGKAARNVN